MNKKSILVIGSKNHPRAERCVSWGDKDYSVSDFDLVIVNTHSLNSDVLSSIQPGYFSNLRDRIIEAQRATNLEVICITSEVIYRKESSWEEEKVTNYHWSPIIPILDEQIGLKIKDRNLKRAYEKFIKGWKRVLETVENNTGYRSGDEFRFRNKVNRLVTNQADKAIAFSIYWYFDGGNYSQYSKLDGGSILFVPEIDNIGDGINSLIEEEMGLEEETPPPWLEDVSIPGESELKREIFDARSKVVDLLRLQKEHSEKLSSLEKYKKLLYLKGIPLQEIVMEGFALLGIKVESPNASNEEDGFFPVESSGKLYIEVRGKDSSGLVMNDVSQMIGRIGSDGEHSDQKYKTWGVIVLNHYRLTPPKSRKNAFEPNLVSKASPFNIALITTSDLYELVSSHLRGEDVSMLSNKLFNTVGVFKLSDVIKQI